MWLSIKTIITLCGRIFYLILGPLALNVKVICVNVYYLAQICWRAVKVQSQGRTTQNRISYSNLPDGTKQTT